MSAAAGPPCGYFDFEKMKSEGLSASLFNWALEYPQREWIAGLLRNFFPIFRLPGAGPARPEIYFVSRYEDVREVLSRDADFPVPWAKQMKDLTGERNFVLGMANDDEYRRNYAQIAKAFRRDEVYERIARPSFKFSEDILASCNGRIDAIQDLISYVPAMLCETYFGVDAPDKVKFAQLTIGMSQYMFGVPGHTNVELGLSAANCFRPLVRESIRKARDGGKPDTVVERLVKMQPADPLNLPDPVIEAHLFGMVTGFIPTNVLAAGDILDTLLRFPQFMGQARDAAFAGDDRRLWRCLQEALRFHFINPGAWRRSAGEQVIAAGTARETRIPAGSYLMASMQSAMFDPRSVKRPHEFDPERPAEDYLVFGHGQHWCVGAYIAIEQITQTLKALLRKKGLRRAADGGSLQRYQIYPAHMMVEFDP